MALDPAWFPTIAWIGVLTAFIGATLAITTTDIKGVLAYSTVSQIGFMMAGLGAAVSGAASVGWFGSLFHMVSHAFFEGLGFLIAGGIIHAIGTRDMRLMGGLRKYMPTSFILMGIMILTTSGLPPFAAFFSKGLNHFKRHKHKRGKPYKRQYNTSHHTLRYRSYNIRLCHTHVQLSVHGQRIRTPAKTPCSRSTQSDVDPCSCPYSLMLHLGLINDPRIRLHVKINNNSWSN